MSYGRWTRALFESGGVDGERRTVGPGDAILIPAASAAWKKAMLRLLNSYFLLHLVADYGGETTGYGQRRQRPGQHESQSRNH
jgi:hypothetical protein